MDAKEAKRIIAEVPYGFYGFKEEFSDDFDKASGYLDCLEGPEVKALVEALEYCAVEPELLHPENNRQVAVAMNALATFRDQTASGRGKDA